MLQSQIKRFAKHDGRLSLSSDVKRGKRALTSSDVDLEKQLQAWRENPSWADQHAEIKVRNVCVCVFYFLFFIFLFFYFCAVLNDLISLA